METRANYVIVGIFTLVAVLAAFGFIYWTAGWGHRGETALLRIRIPGSASGLGRGSAVLFNGVKVGDVQRVFIDVNNPQVAIADAKVDRATPITKSTEADIGLAGLTGTANVELKGASKSEPNLLDEAERKGTIAEITANPSAVTNLLETAQTILTRADRVVSQLEGFVSDARGPLTQTVDNVQSFSEALSRNAKGIDTFLENVSALSDTLQNVSGQLNSALQGVQNLVASVDRDKVANIVDNVDSFSQSLKRNGDSIDKVVADVHGLSQRVQGVADNVDKTLNSAQQLMASVDRDKIANVVDNLDTFSQALSRNAQGIDTMVANVNGLTEKIGGVSDRLDSTLAGADKVIGAVDPEKVGKIVDNVQGFSDALKRNADGIDQVVADMHNLAQRVQGVSDKLDSTLSSAQGLIDSVDREKVATIVANMDQFSQSLSRNADAIDKVVANVDDITKRIQGVSDQLDTTLASADRLINSVDTDKVSTIVADVQQFVANTKAATSGLDQIMADIDNAVKSVNQVSDSANGMVAKANGILDGVDPDTVRTAITDFQQAGATVNKAADDIAKVTGKVGGRADDIDSFIQNATQLAQRLNEASVRVDGVMAKLDGLLGSKDAEGVLSDARATLQKFRDVADQLDARIGPITEGLSRFSGQGLRDAEALISEARQAVVRIEQAADSLQRNPQRILTGGEGTVRQFDGRARR